jgi:hypothetical protein
MMISTNTFGENRQTRHHRLAGKALPLGHLCHLENVKRG